MEPFQRHHHLLINRTGATHQTSFCFTLNSQTAPELFRSPQADPPMCTDALVTVTSPLQPHATYFQGLSPFPLPPLPELFPGHRTSGLASHIHCLNMSCPFDQNQKHPKHWQGLSCKPDNLGRPLVSHSFIHSFTQKDCASTVVPARPCVLAMEQMKKKRRRGDDKLKVSLCPPRTQLIL